MLSRFCLLAVISLSSLSLTFPLSGSSSLPANIVTPCAGPTSRLTSDYPPDISHASASDDFPSPATHEAEATITGPPITVYVAVSSTKTLTVMSTSKTTDTPHSSWAAPSQYTDLEVFNITNFPAGQQNLAVVTSIPATASAAYANFSIKDEADDQSSILQILYPAHSINPRRRPQGGAEFYATPLDITDAWNVTLRYSVFFPIDFDWVLAGKLPGIYGGHGGCSGGNAAIDCFSTRLMWRKGGLGELYLYAPKDKQTEALCSDSQSVCDTSYGFSIGRGAFHWTAGAWTVVSQTVYLNTPGEQDGSFALDVNGIRVIDRHDIFYRGVPPTSEQDVDRLLFADTSASMSFEQYRYSSHIFSMLSSILQGAPGVAAWRDRYRTFVERPSNLDPRAEEMSPLTVTETIYPVVVMPTEIMTTLVITSVSPLPTPEQNATNFLYPPVGFIGLFFSTFFGGHEDRYATPKDQFVWFKDFQIFYNS
ncbi:hypothetical protein AX17_001924 [Amanita inopinata Kibby_2008]|nr:hypothetical protein AX17_001924 [Amanita inopinata Kibby_2008]